MNTEQSVGTFVVVEFEPADVAIRQPVTTAMPTGIAILRKDYTGEIEGRSVTLFTSCRDADSGAGCYVALESFEGQVAGRTGSFSFVHTAATHGTDRYAETFAIVDGSGTAGLAGITGTGALIIDDDGTHRIELDYAIAGRSEG